MIDSNHNNTEIPADPHEDQTSQTSVKVIAAKSKAKAKPPQRELVDTPRIRPMHERRWIDIDPSEPTLAAYDVSKKVISLLRHNQTVQREENGAIQFYRKKFKKAGQCDDSAWIIPSHLPHWMCFNLHSIINDGLIPGGQDSSRRQTVFFLPINPRNKNHKDPEHVTIK